MLLLEADVLVMQHLLKARAFNESEGGFFAPMFGSWAGTAPLLASASFDAILLAHVPSDASADEHSPHLHTVLPEAHRLLRDGGMLAIAGGAGAQQSVAALAAGFEQHPFDLGLVYVKVAE